MSSEEETPNSSNKSSRTNPSSSREIRDEIVSGLTKFLRAANYVGNFITDTMRETAQGPTDLNSLLGRVHTETENVIPRVLLGAADTALQAGRGLCDTLNDTLNQAPLQQREKLLKEGGKIVFDLLFSVLAEQKNKSKSCSQTDRNSLQSSSQVVKITEIGNDDEDNSNDLKSECSSVTEQSDEVESIFPLPPLPFESITLPGGDAVIQEKELLGEGSFGKVFKGKFNGKPAAIKTMTGISTTCTESFLKEMNMLKRDCRHEHILELWAVFDKDFKSTPTYPRVVMEYCGKGDLKSYFKRIRDFEDDFKILPRNPYKRILCSKGPSGVLVVKMSELFQWSTMLTLGMEFLAENKIVHGDLALRNLLLTDDNVLKICDFGLSRELTDKGYYRIQPQNGVLPTTHTAPEVFQDLKLTIASDVWAYGITLWEMFSLGKDVGDDITFKEFERADRIGVLLLRPLYANDDLYDIMKKCWDQTAENRPTFNEIVFELVKFQLA